MAKIDTETKTGLGLSEKIGIGFMVGVGLIVVTSFLAAAGYIGWSKLTAAAPTVDRTFTQQSNTNDTSNAKPSNTNAVTPTVEGLQTDRSFVTE